MSGRNFQTNPTSTVPKKQTDVFEPNFEDDFLFDGSKHGVSSNKYRDDIILSLPMSTNATLKFILSIYKDPDPSVVSIVVKSRMETFAPCRVVVSTKLGVIERENSE